MLLYPLYKLGALSLQQYGLFELIQREGKWIGFDNYRSVLGDSVFWHTLERTVIFTIANVTLTIGFGTLIALLLVRVSTWVRILLTSALVLVWSMPVVVAVQVWFWMTNHQNGVLNYVLSSSTWSTTQHDWFATTFSKLAMVTRSSSGERFPSSRSRLRRARAGLTRARRGGGDRRRGPAPGLPRRHLPDAEADPSHPDEPLDHLGLRRLHPAVSPDQRFDVDSTNYLMGVYVYIEGYAHSDFGRGAAISLLMLLMVAPMSILYVRRMLHMGDTA